MIESVQVYTAGCPRSLVTAANLRMAVKEMGLNIEVEEIDQAEIRRAHGIAITPTIRINGDIKTQGKAADVDRCKEFLSEYL